ncbi:MAG: hypothetical protein ABEJ26_06400 [Halosimplex sp.]
MVRDTIREAIGLSDSDDGPPRPDVALPPNQVLDLLSSRRRRIAVRVTATLDAEEIVGQNEYARQIAAIERGCDPETVTSGEYKSVYNTLLQFHFEKLEAADVVNWSERAKDVGRGPEAADVAHLLSVIEAHCDDYEEPETAGEPVSGT